MWSSKYVSGISMFYMFICGEILQRVVETEIWKYYIYCQSSGSLMKIRKQIPWSNIRTFQTFLEHFPRDVFTLQNFTLKVYPINCLLPAFLFATKSTENLKTQFLHLFLLLLKSEIRSMFFLVCLMGSLFTISCPATFNLWNMIPKNRENISQICTSVYLPTLNTYILFYTYNETARAKEIYIWQKNELLIFVRVGASI